MVKAEQVPPQDTVPQQARRGLLPPGVIQLIVPPLKVGSWWGAGASVGIVAAILRDASPWKSGAMTGTQWAVLGSTYWFSRLIAIRALVGNKEPTAFDRVKASAAAGIPTGAMLSLSLRGARGIRSLASSMGFCSVAALGGQWLVNVFGGHSRTQEPKPEDSHWLGGRFSPLKQLSDEEYVDMMDEKILRVDADIALIDERIAQLREQQQSQGKPK